jgi:hypothetical protein
MPRFLKATKLLLIVRQLEILLHGRFANPFGKATCTAQIEIIAVFIALLTLTS